MKKSLLIPLMIISLFTITYAEITDQEIKDSINISAISYCNLHSDDNTCPQKITSENISNPLNIYISSDYTFSSKTLRSQTTQDKKTYSQNKYLNEYLQQNSIQPDQTQLLNPNTKNIFQAMTTYNKAFNTVYITFRGSANISNWLLNFDYGEEPFFANKNVYIHGGFNQYLIAILNSNNEQAQNDKQSLKQWLSGLKNKNPN